LAALAVLTALTVVLGYSVIKGPFAGQAYRIDQAVRDWTIQYWRHFRVSHAFEQIGALGDNNHMLIVLSPIGLVTWRLGHRRATAMIALCFAGAVLMAFVGKMVVPKNHRVPLQDLERIGISGYAFPSGHAARSLAVALAVGILVGTWPPLRRRVIRSIAALYVVAVGFARVWTQAHTISDVIGAWVVTVPWVLACGVLLGYIGRRQPIEPAIPQRSE
jgi:undecaprenyl-diphosphatase